MPVGPIQPGAVQRSFPTQDVKDETALRAFTDVQNTYSGSSEAFIATYYIGCIKADEGKLGDAEKLFKDVADKANDRYGSLAKMALAQIYFADGRDSQGEAMLKQLIDNPTPFVSKEQATIMLAKYI